MKSSTTHIFSSRHDSQPNWVKQYKHVDPLRIGARQHRALVIFITLNLSCLNSWNFYQTLNIICKAFHNIFKFIGAIIHWLWKRKYNKQLKPNCTDLFLPLKLQTKPCHIIDLLHREFHKDSKTSTFAILRCLYELLWISKLHPEICKNKRKWKQILHREP